MYVFWRDITPIDALFCIIHICFRQLLICFLDVELLKSTIQTKATDIQQETGEDFDIENGLDLSSPLSVIPTCWLTLIQNEDADPNDHPTFHDIDNIFDTLTNGTDDDLAELQIPEGDNGMFRIITYIYINRF